MTYYEFLNNKNDNIKLTTDNLNINTLLKIFNLIESKNDKVESINLTQENFNILLNEIQKDKFQGDELYKDIVDNNKLWGADIIINNNENKNIITFIGKKHIEENKLQLYLIN